MNSKTLEFLNNKRDSLPVAYFDYMNNLRHSMSYQSICFVEGYEDTLFYKNFFYKKINIPKLEVFYKDCGNKENVKRIFEKINKSNNSCSKTIFYIVDHDYDGPPVDVPNFITIPYYCFENSYLLDNNINVIFTKFFTADAISKISEFKSLYDLFVDYVLLYSAYKRIIVSTNKIKTNKDIIKEKIKSFEIRNNELILKYQYELSDLNELLLKTVITISSKTIHENKEFLFKNQYLIDGKLLFDLLIRYLKQNLNYDITKQDLLEISDEIEFSLKLS